MVLPTFFLSPSDPVGPTTTGSALHPSGVIPFRSKGIKVADTPGFVRPVFAFHVTESRVSSLSEEMELLLLMVAAAVVAAAAATWW